MHKELKLGSSGKVALVDVEDYMMLNRYQWQLSDFGRDASIPRVYRRTARAGRPLTVYLSRQIMQAPRGSEVQYINNNPLDCRRSNLRIVSGCIVKTESKRRPYRVYMKVNGRTYLCGCWPKLSWAEDARRAASDEATRLRGQKLTAKQIQRALDLATGREAESRAA